MKTIKIWTDGGVINNPGEGAIGVVIDFGDRVNHYKAKLKEVTNNEAEYLAVIYALKKLKEIFGKKKLKDYMVILHLDSELVGNQLIGKYKIKEENLQKLFLKFWNLKVDIPNIEVKIIPREENKIADKLVKSLLFKNTLF
ncbi:MAG: ribonuclease HI family protein [candidate division WOR-3 bacterium]